MGKRKNADKEDKIARKIRKLERKMAKIRRRNNRYSLSSNSSNAEQRSAMEIPVDHILDDGLDVVSILDVQENQEPHQENTMEPNSVSNTMTEAACELDPVIINILGDEPTKAEVFSPAVHKDIACRWSDILINGLKEDIKKEIIKSYNVPENLTLAKSPLLNAEVKAAVNENAVKKDSILSEKQDHLAGVITCLSELMSSFLDTSSDATANKNRHLKLLSDAGRLLCHIHYSETMTRKNFLLACLNKGVKDNIKDLKRDRLLFGGDLSENLKSMKAITRTGVEMRPTPTRNKPQSKDKQPEATTSRTLNWRGPPPPAPRRGYPRPSSTAGGRRQPTATAAINSFRRAPKTRGKTSRR